jgi:hypothetical protein
LRWPAVMRSRMRSGAGDRRRVAVGSGVAHALPVLARPSSGGRPDRRGRSPSRRARLAAGSPLAPGETFENARPFRAQGLVRAPVVAYLACGVSARHLRAEKFGLRRFVNAALASPTMPPPNPCSPARRSTTTSGTSSRRS